MLTPSSWMGALMTSGPKAVTPFFTMELSERNSATRATAATTARVTRILTSLFFMV